MADDFRSGDLVQLKSGGPMMTVEEVRQESKGTRVWCTWFDHQHKRMTDDFTQDVLKKIEKHGSTQVRGGSPGDQGWTR